MFHEYEHYKFRYSLQKKKEFRYNTEHAKVTSLSKSVYRLIKQ